MKPLLFLLAGLSGLASSGAAENPAAVQVQRTGNTIKFAPFGGKNMVLVQCPQRSLQGKWLNDTSESRMIWPKEGGLLFDYASKQLLMRNHFKNVELTPMQLRLTCDGSAPELEVGAGLKIVETGTP